MKKSAVVPRHILEDCVTPALMHGALGRAGVLMEPFTHSGLFQPVGDWVEHDLPRNIRKPFTIYERPDLPGWEIVQQQIGDAHAQ